MGIDANGPLNNSPLELHLESLRQVGSEHSQGVFTIDLEQARLKLHRFQLHQHQDYLLCFLRALVMLGARSIQMAASSCGVRMSAKDARMSPERLSSLLINRGPQLSLAEQELTVALSHVLAQPNGKVRIESLHREGGWLAELPAGSLRTLTGSHPHTLLILEASWSGRWWRGLLERILGALPSRRVRRLCRYFPVPLEPFPEGNLSSQMAYALVGSDPRNHLVPSPLPPLWLGQNSWREPWSLRVELASRAEVRFVVAGISAEPFPFPNHWLQAQIVIADHRLPLDLSRSKVVQDAPLTRAHLARLPSILKDLEVKILRSLSQQQAFHQSPAVKEFYANKMQSYFHGLWPGRKLSAHQKRLSALPLELGGPPLQPFLEFYRHWGFLAWCPQTVHADSGDIPALRFNSLKPELLVRTLLVDERLPRSSFICAGLRIDIEFRDGLTSQVRWAGWNSPTRMAPPELLPPGLQLTFLNQNFSIASQDHDGAGLREAYRQVLMRLPALLGYLAFREPLRLHALRGWIRERYSQKDERVPGCFSDPP